MFFINPPMFSALFQLFSVLRYNYILIFNRVFVNINFDIYIVLAKVDLFWEELCHIILFSDATSDFCYS